MQTEPKTKLTDLKKQLTEEHRKGQIAVNWSNLFIKVRNNYKTIDCDGVGLPGRITALVGRNKCGKTSILDAISGNLPSSYKIMFGSKIEFNGRKLEDRSFISYIRNRENFISDLTVRDHIKFVYAMSNKFDRDVRTLYKSVLIECAEKRLMDLTNAQKLIVKIAEAEILERKVILVNMSKLDPLVINEATTHLKRLCREYMSTVIITVDEASSKYLPGFDKTILLANGCTLYQGNYTNIKKYLAEKSIIFSNEYGKPFKYNQSEPTSSIVNEIISSSKQKATLISFLADEYFKHKTGTELNPFLETTDETKISDKIPNGSLSTLKLYIFYIQYFMRKEFSLVQAGCNILMPEILFIFGSLLYKFGFDQVNLTEYFESTAKTNGELLRVVYIEKISANKSIENGSILPPSTVDNLDTVIYPLFIAMVYPLLLFRTFILTGFNINLFTVASVLGKKELAQDFYKKHLFIKAYCGIRIGIILLESISTAIGLGILLGGFYATYTIKAISLIGVFRFLELLVLLLIYKFAISFRRYRSISINIGVLIIKSFFVTILLSLLLTNYMGIMDYTSKGAKGIVPRYFLFSIFSSKIGIYIGTMSVLAVLVLGSIGILKYYN